MHSAASAWCPRARRFESGAAGRWFTGSAEGRSSVRSSCFSHKGCTPAGTAHRGEDSDRRGPDEWHRGEAIGRLRPSPRGSRRLRARCRRDGCRFAALRCLRRDARNRAGNGGEGLRDAKELIISFAPRSGTSSVSADCEKCGNLFASSTRERRASCFRAACARFVSSERFRTANHLSRSRAEFELGLFCASDRGCWSRPATVWWFTTTTTQRPLSESAESFDARVEGISEQIRRRANVDPTFALDGRDARAIVRGRRHI